MLLDEISEQTISTPQMDASKVSVSYDETRIDHVWRRRLENTLKNNVRTATLKEALQENTLKNNLRTATLKEALQPLAIFSRNRYGGSDGGGGGAV